MRLSSNQNIIIAGVDSEEKTMIDTLIGKYGIAGNQKRSAARLNSMACVALPTCGLSLAESERYLPSLMDEIEEILDEVGSHPRCHHNPYDGLSEWLRSPLYCRDRFCWPCPWKI
jgi:sulfite reductase (NADPH) hemoprotein beta-component